MMNEDRFTTKVGETHPDWSGDPVQPHSPLGTTVDQELAAMASMADAMDGLDDDARGRVLRWVNARFAAS